MGRLLKLDASGNWTVLAEYGMQPGEVGLPTDIVVDTNGHLYVSELEAHRVQCLRVDGKWETIADNGFWYGQVKAPRSLAVAPDGTLYVGEVGRIQRRSPSGRWVIAASKGSSAWQVGDTPYGLAAGPNGELYIADTSNNRVVLYPSPCRTGDLNNDGEITISDVVLLLRLSVLGEAPGSPNPTRVGDIDRDGKTTVADVTKLLSHLVKGTPLPPE